MTPSDTSFVDPSSLSLPSPQSDAALPVVTVSNVPTSGPSRKRPRSELTPEERKDARAHRNRIAAQNSRDRRKAHFSYLERRVAELEEENRQLRAGMGLSDTSRSEESKYQEKEKARDKENQELRERIKTLEQGWDAVVKALAAQGLPTGLPLPKPPTSEPAPENADDSPSTPSSDTQAFPVLTPSETAYPTPTLSDSGVFPDQFDSTRHLARVATVEAIPPSMPLQRVELTRIRATLNLPLGRNQFRTPLNLPKSSMRRRWRNCYAKSSCAPPPLRRQLYLWTRPPPPHSRQRPPPRH